MGGGIAAMGLQDRGEFLVVNHRGLIPITC